VVPEERATCRFNLIPIEDVLEDVHVVLAGHPQGVSAGETDPAPRIVLAETNAKVVREAPPLAALTLLHRLFQACGLAHFMGCCSCESDASGQHTEASHHLEGFPSYEPFPPFHFVSALRHCPLRNETSILNVSIHQ
jgi:hypothetical protein